jgi:toxin HigB-1
LELAFDNRSLRTICENEARARSALGASVADALKHRVADLRAATSVADLLAGRPRLLGGTNPPPMVLDLYEGHVLVFGANHTSNPFDSDGKLNWLRVSRIKILEIRKNHVDQS